jgi:hypothetical protein
MRSVCCRDAWLISVLGLVFGSLGRIFDGVAGSFHGVAGNVTGAPGGTTNNLSRAICGGSHGSAPAQQPQTDGED